MQFKLYALSIVGLILVSFAMAKRPPRALIPLKKISLIKTIDCNEPVDSLPIEFKVPETTISHLKNQHRYVLLKNHISTCIKLDDKINLISQENPAPITNLAIVGGIYQAFYDDISSIQKIAVKSQVSANYFKWANPTVYFIEIKSLPPIPGSKIDE